MKRLREQKSAIVRRGIAFFVAVLLAFSPALNLTANPSAAAMGHHHRSHSDSATGHQQPHDCPGHDHLDLRCLQCLVMGGVALAGIELPPTRTPTDQSIDATWSLAGHRRESASVHIPISRGPPSFA
jgi:hypothetical protein